MSKTYIDKLREKPEHHRRRIAWGVSGAISMFIAAVWVTSFGYFNGIGPNVAEIARSNSENSPANVIKRGAANVWGAFSGDEMSTQLEEVATTTPTLEFVPDPNFVPPQVDSTTIN